MKVFCIGYNKTGTTSLTKMFSDNGFLVAPQQPFEYNTYSYIYGNDSTIIEMIKNDYPQYSFFQDVPFSLPNFYKSLYNHFPTAKFILTVRDNEEQWYNSFINYQRKTFTNFKNPSLIQYVHTGWIYKILTDVHKTPKYDPFNYESLVSSYKNHINDVSEFFQNKKNSLLTLNLSKKNSVDELEKFLGVSFENRSIPHLNKSS